MGAVTQPELYTYGKGDNLTGIQQEYVFEPVAILGHKYYLERYPDFFFIVRKDQYCDEKDCERVCLYRDNVVNVYLHDDGKPFTRWLINELRNGRKIKTIYRDMEDKAAEWTVTTKK